MPNTPPATIRFARLAFLAYARQGRHRSTSRHQARVIPVTNKVPPFGGTWPLPR